MDPKLNPFKGDAAAVGAADEAGVAAGALDAAEDALPKDRGVEVGGVVAGSGVLTAWGNINAPGVLPAVLVLAGVLDDVFGK